MNRLIGALFLSLCLVSPSWAAIAYVQSKKDPSDASSDASASTMAVAYDSNVTAGSLGVACMTADNGTSSTVTGVSGSSSGTWTQAVHAERVGDQILDIWYKENMAGGADTITATYSSSRPYRRMIIAEYSGVATSSALDKTDSNLQEPAPTSTDGTTSTSQTTATTNQLIVGCTIVMAGGSVGITAGTGFTKRQDSATAAPIALEDRIEASATSVAATFTIDASHNTLTLLSTFKEPGGGGGPATNFFRLRVQP